MRAVLQRVESASVTVSNRLISKIGKGILVFLGIELGDSEADADYLLEKIINLRIFEDETGKMNLSLLDMDAELLVVSQFTLLGDCRKGRRPSFTNAARPEQARPLYDHLVSQAKKQVRFVAAGEFQAMMTVVIANDGPVTMLLDSKRFF
ncbi:MAG: D-tyrosyl-tRNA(Tyr) deacylase [Syntrophobacterales bacterium]|nr:D-tyrosyl-tRNA(Tyr) deacylase [Syntrophobacterales bacterium]